MKRRLFLKTLATATASLPAAGFSAKPDANDWEITPIPLPGVPPAITPRCQAIFVEKNILWALHGQEMYFKTVDSEEWQNYYIDYAAGTPYCFYAVPDEKKSPPARTIYLAEWRKTPESNFIRRVDGGDTKEDSYITLNQPSRLTSLLLTEDENGSPTLFAADAAQRNVLRYDADGKFMHRLYADGELIVPSPYLAMCVGRDGLLRVVNPGRHRVEAFHVRADSTPQEKSLTWGTESKTPEGFAGCCNPAWLAVTESGNFFTSEKRFLRLKLHDPEGNFLEEVPLPPKEKNVVTEGYPVAAEGENLYVLDTNANAVYRYAKTGNAGVPPA